MGEIFDSLIVIEGDIFIYRICRMSINLKYLKFRNSSALQEGSMSIKKEYLSKTITVTTEDALKNAVKAGYGIICIQGDYANKIAGKMRNSDTGNILSNASLAIGFFFFTPLFLVGLVGKILTKDMSKYKIISVGDYEVQIKHKSIKE